MESIYLSIAHCVRDIMPVNAKGSRRERQLIGFLTKKGYVCHRVAGSGHLDSAICDIVAVKKGKAYFVECKSRKSLYYTRDNIDQLNLMVKEAKKAKAIPLLAVKLNYKPWVIVNIAKKIPRKVG